MGIRRDGREPDDLRPIAFTRDFTEFAAGSVLVEFGRTRVLCTASVEERVPPWLRGKGRGWVTAEYSMLPGSTSERNDREAARGKQSGRTQEIQRLIGRSLRAVTDLATMGEVQITVDCDVLQADGGTRTASICGGYVALHDACSRLVADQEDGRAPAHRPVRGDLGRHRRRAAVPRPRLLRGRARRGRHERGDDRRRAASSRCRAPPRAQPFSRSELDDLLGLAEARDRARSSTCSARCWPSRPRRAATVTHAVRPRHRQPRQGARDRARSSRDAGVDVELVPRPDDVPEVDETGATLEENARLKAVGALRGHRPARDRRRHRARGRRARRRARRALGPLRGRRRHLRRQRATRCSSACDDVPTERRTARFATVALARWPDGREVAAFGDGRGHDRRREPQGRGGVRLRPGVRPRRGRRPDASPR